ncbi:MAG: thioesterase family protein, partial [Rhodospirillales bacterium]|nr:thioesterase family protein [Rhodospirillales bacterium]
MKDTLCPGVGGTRRIVVDRTRTIDFMGKAHRVYATPWMVSDMEYACRDLILPHLDEGEDSVGVRVEIEHLAPTPLGEWVDIVIAVTAIDGRRVTLDFEIRDAAEIVGKGNHTRFVVDTATAERRLRAKMD